jgi:hypothetical protein
VIDDRFGRDHYGDHDHDHDGPPPPPPPVHCPYRRAARL